MKPFLHRPPCLALLALCATAAPARSDFYRLDGRFECSRPGRRRVLRRDAVARRDAARAAACRCRAGNSTQRDRTAAGSAAAPGGRSIRSLAIADADQARAARARRSARAAPGGGRQRPARAVELIAWSALRGIGAGRNAEQAYYLYGEAADLGVPHARDNQALVFEQSLTQDQRQRVLEREAKADAAVRPSALLSANHRDGMAGDVP